MPRKPNEPDSPGLAGLKGRTTLIYHIVKEGEFLTCLVGDAYEPASLRDVGFVHCSSEAAVIAVANDYFGGAEEKLLLLRVDPTKLTPQTRYEDAVPVDGIRAAAVPDSTLFPHVYGPIEISAIDGIGVLERQASGYTWPEMLAPIDAYLHETKERRERPDRRPSANDEP